MEYVKNQKDAIAMVKQMVADGQVAQDVAEKYFPELKKSEDEEIRKVLIDWFSDKHAADDFRGIAWERIVAWLEKQGDTFTKKDVDDAYLKGISNAKNELKKQGEQKPTEEYNITGIGSKNAQGKLGEMIKKLKPVNEVLEQKPANTVKDVWKDMRLEVWAQASGNREANVSCDNTTMFSLCDIDEIIEKINDCQIKQKPVSEDLEEAAAPDNHE